MGSDYKNKIDSYVQKSWEKHSEDIQANLNDFAEFLVDSLTLLILLRCESKDVKKAIQKQDKRLINSDKAFRKFDQDVFGGWLGEFIFNKYKNIKQLKNANYDAIYKGLKSEKLPEGEGAFFQLYHMVISLRSDPSKSTGQDVPGNLDEITVACNTYINSPHFKIWSRVRYRIRFLECS